MAQAKSTNITRDHQRRPRSIAQPPVFKPSDKLSDVSAVCAIYRGHLAAKEAIMGVANQPRHDGVTMLDEWWTYHGDAAIEMVERLREMVPADVHEAYERAAILLENEFDAGNGLNEIAQLALDLALAKTKAAAITKRADKNVKQLSEMTSAVRS